MDGAEGPCCEVAVASGPFWRTFVDEEDSGLLIIILGSLGR